MNCSSKAESASVYAIVCRGGSSDGFLTMRDRQRGVSLRLTVLSLKPSCSFSHRPESLSYRILKSTLQNYQRIGSGYSFNPGCPLVLSRWFLMLEAT